MLFLLGWRDAPASDLWPTFGMSTWVASLSISAWQFVTGRGLARKQALDDWTIKFSMPGLYALGHTLLAWQAHHVVWTLDNYFYAFDGLLPLPIAWAAKEFVSRIGWVSTSLEIVYATLTIMAFVLLRMERQDNAASGRLLCRWMLVGLIGFGLYAVAPGVGPNVAFYSKFQADLPAPGTVQLALVCHPSASARNAMPSLHAAWAFLLVIMALQMTAAALVGVTLFAFATVLATLGLGEHYLVDLVVALPFVVAVHGLVSLFDGYAKRKASAVATCIASSMIGAWLLILRFGIADLREYPWIASLLVLVTLTVSGWLIARMESSRGRPYPAAIAALLGR